MTVSVTLQDGATDKYMRFGDAYVKHNDGSLDVVPCGAQQPHSYARRAHGPTYRATKSNWTRRSGIGPNREVLAVEVKSARPRLLSHLTIDEARNEPGIDRFTSVAVIDAVLLDHRRLSI
jgi:hypothetical protein